MADGTVNTVCRFGDLTIDLGQRRLWRAGEEIPLGKLSFRLLEVLVEAAPNMVDYDRLTERVWGGRETSPETITQRVKLLRDAIGDDAVQPRYIALVRREGYRLIPEVQPVDDASPAAATRTPGLHLQRISIAGAVLLGLVVLVLILRPQPEEPGSAPREKIAVLPLDNFSSDPDSDYFSDGMTEALITRLAKIDGFTVISRRSVMPFKDTTQTLPEIARALNVGTVIEGSAQLEGDRVRITAQLIDAATDHHIWEHSYDRDLVDILSLQDEIAIDIARQVRSTINPNEALLTSGSITVNPDSYRAYLKGMYHLNKIKPADIKKGMAYLHEAVARDPGDGLAYAGLALGYATLAHGPNAQPDALYMASEAAERALAFAPGLAEAHAAMADVKLYLEWDWEGAEASFRRANELNPSLAMNHYHYAWYLVLFRRHEEAIAEHELARRIDPLSPLHSVWLAGLYVYVNKSNYPRAIEQLERLLETYPDYPAAYYVMGFAYDAAGRHKKAIEYHKRAVEAVEFFEFALGLSYAMDGQRDKAEEVLRKMEDKPLSPSTAYGRAIINAGLGNLDEAFDLLNYEPHHAWVAWVTVDPFIRPILENHPRFDALLARFGLKRSY